MVLHAPYPHGKGRQHTAHEDLLHFHWTPNRGHTNDCNLLSQMCCKIWDWWQGTMQHPQQALMSIIKRGASRHHNWLHSCSIILIVFLNCCTKCVPQAWAHIQTLNEPATWIQSLTMLSNNTHTVWLNFLDNAMDGRVRQNCMGDQSGHFSAVPYVWLPFQGRHKLYIP